MSIRRGSFGTIGAGTEPGLGAASRGHSLSARRASAMVFEDPESRALQAQLDRLAPSEATLLIHGETGTGKELAARYIHARSRRRDGPFVAVNCGALSDSLAEAELFGHEKGAFTGAVRSQVGWFESAHGGTLLLDEIGDLPLPLQVKLLRVLQEREVTRVGSRRPVPVDVRVIAATNVDLEAAIQTRQFREDLFFRLAVATVRLPALRDRGRDIGPLARHFLQIYRVELGRPELDFDRGALEALAGHAWPGNIRELENVVHQAVLLADGPRITAGDLGLRRRPAASSSFLPADLEGQIRVSVERALAAGEPEVFDRTVASAVRAAFDLADGNQVRAAALLGISRNTLRTQLSHLGLLGRRPLPGPAAPPGQPGQLRIGFQKYGTLGLLKSDGALERRLGQMGVQVAWTEFPAGPQLLEALSLGRIDFGTTGETPPVFAQAAGAPLLYVAHDPPAPSGEAIVVRAGGGIRSVGDLRGCRIGLNMGSNVHYLLVRALQQYGVGIHDVVPVYLSPEDGPAERLSGGALDAWVIWDPLLTEAQRSHDLRVLVDGSGLVSNRQFYLALRAYAAECPDIIDVLLAELRRAGEFAVNNPAEAARRAAMDLGIDASALEIALRRLTYGARPLDDVVIREQQAIADTLHSLGLLPGPISVREAVWPAARALS
jgi:aliphatic sulfonates family ABC transporter substrate-binding protein